VSSLNLASTGLLDPSLDSAALSIWRAICHHKAGKRSTKGTVKFRKLCWSPEDRPQGPVTVNFDRNTTCTRNAGVLNPSTLNIGSRWRI